MADPSVILHPSSELLTAGLLYCEMLSEEPGVSAPSLHPKAKRRKDKLDTRGQSFIARGAELCKPEIVFKKGHRQKERDLKM